MEAIDYPYVCKLNEHVCRLCSKVGTLKGTTEKNQELIDKFIKYDWTFNIKFYSDDEREYNLQCSKCRTGVFGSIGSNSY
jgi:hypothetical protein